MGQKPPQSQIKIRFSTLSLKRDDEGHMDSYSFTKHSLLGTVVNCNKPLAKSHIDRIILVFRLVVAPKKFLILCFLFGG